MRAIHVMTPAAAALLIAGAAPALAGGLEEREEAVLRGLFPAASGFEPRDVVLGQAVVERIEKLARTRVRERIVTFYTVRDAGAPVGYAVIHSHVVRTKRETLAIAFEPD